MFYWWLLRTITTLGFLVTCFAFRCVIVLLILDEVAAEKLQSQIIQGHCFGVRTCLSLVKHVLVDFNRGYGSTREDLHKQEETKKESYADLMAALYRHHSAVFFPLVSGYNGAIAVDTWTALMDPLDIRPKAQEQVLMIAIRALCIGFSTMVDIRLGCLNTLHQQPL